MPNNEKTKNEENNILAIGREDQYRTVEELVKRSQPSSVYYTLLVMSSLVISSGLLIGNSAITIGGMLITPVLSPLLLIGLGLSIGQLTTIKRAVILTIQSFFVVIVGALVLSLIFGPGDAQIVPIFADHSIRTVVLYFIVALAAGTAATFGWTRKSIAEVLPGIAIAVSLVPPLAWIGIGVSRLDTDLIQFNATVLLFNLLGILIGSIVAFSLLKFYRVGKKVEQETKQVEKQIVEKKKEKEDEKYEKL
jgi:uncharacterized hydrophobic protein (TIGR00271 family)